MTAQTFTDLIAKDLEGAIADAKAFIDACSGETREVAAEEWPDARRLMENASNIAYRKAYVDMILNFLTDLRVGKDPDEAFANRLASAAETGIVNSTSPIANTYRSRQQQGMVAALREISSAMARVRRKVA